ncbi:MAG: gamma-glutamyl-gamma-aminobutyrate hydrolase family protein, partial [Anaerolineae bacterium]|nr:gamma-glutamyl-gamma-aminobutyrate hydrolase family protein [Anaerolineae bacterium]
MQAPQAPLIGVIADHKTLNPTDRSDSARTFVGAYATYLRCLTAAGALPVVVPLELSSEALRGIFDRLDGVLLTGGGDVDPAYFGEPPHPMLAEVEPARDEAELLISRWAAQADVPLLGICRGHQVVNVALGGTLFQDIPSQITSTLFHDSGTAFPPAHPAHDVRLESGSRLHAILGR